MKYFAKLKEKAKRLEDDIVVLYLATRDNRVPLAAKLLILLVVGYALSPIDFIPDFIPVLGYLDDLILLPLGIYVALKLIPDHVITELRGKAKTMPRLRENKIAGAVIILIWLLVLVMILNHFLFRN